MVQKLYRMQSIRKHYNPKLFISRSFFCAAAYFICVEYMLQQRSEHWTLAEHNFCSFFLRCTYTMVCSARAFVLKMNFLLYRNLLSPISKWLMCTKRTQYVIDSFLFQFVHRSSMVFCPCVCELSSQPLFIEWCAAIGFCFVQIFFFSAFPWALIYS